MMKTIFLLRDGLTAGPQRIDRFPAPALPRHSFNAVTHGWSGTIRIMASIELVPDADSWAVIVEETIVTLRGHTNNLMWHQEGALIWVKAEIEPLPFGSVYTGGELLPFGSVYTGGELLPFSNIGYGGGRIDRITAI